MEQDILGDKLDLVLSCNRKGFSSLTSSNRTVKYGLTKQILPANNFASISKSGAVHAGSTQYCSSDC
jgi:hypothetical protein